MRKERGVLRVLYKKYQISMKYLITKWTINKLYSIYKKGNLNLSPPYQRNFIWSIDDQQTLIESIKVNKPIPNFFLLQKEGKYEMVDGQQRSRTIISFLDKQFPDEEGNYYNKKKLPEFHAYNFPVTIITDKEGESIQKFYALVNKTGIHLNKPEVRKSDFYNTNLLKLVNEIVSSVRFKPLKLFTEHSLKRMNDIEFVSELIVLIKTGHVDKKGPLDEYFEKDLRSEECAEIKVKFFNVLDKINALNNYFPINKSRYKQRNDFYTLFDFLLCNIEINNDTLVYFYKILILIADDIKPTQEKCEPLKEYARNCVTQSNSKLARENRINFFNELLLNKGKRSNKVQKKILKFYKLTANDIKTVDGYLTLNVQSLSRHKEIEFLQ